VLGPLARLLPYALAFFSSLCIMVLELVASRLVVRHVGMSLPVWTSVIGVILAGICLGNVLGGKLADRIEPRRAIGPLYFLGGALVLLILWVNVAIGLIPGVGSIPLNPKTVLVVTLDFLIPATVLGMISPVVAKMAVEEARKSGTALGDVYMLGAIGSIIGTFLAGFYLIYLAPSSTIVALVAAALLLLGSLLAGSALPALLGLAAAILLALGSLEPSLGILPMPGFTLGWFKLNALMLAGQAVALIAGLWGAAQLRAVNAGLASSPPIDQSARLETRKPHNTAAPVSLRDLCLLSFIASLGFMAFEMVAGRLVTRHLGSSVYGWTSVIGVLLAGLSIGNFIGGKIADRVTGSRPASWLFLAASVLVLFVVVTEQPATFVVKLIRAPIESLMLNRPVPVSSTDHDAFLSSAITMNERTGFLPVKYHWGFRILFWTSIVFLPASIALGTVSPLLAKLAVERMREARQPIGQAIGQVYAWGMVGSILGTFLTGFLLIDLVGTRGVLLLLGMLMALSATSLGSIIHAAWAGIPVGLCAIALGPFLIPPGFAPLAPVRDFLSKHALKWCLRERSSPEDDPDGSLVYADESNYYYIKVTNRDEGKDRKRTLVLDNLIHGYFILEKPERLDYDYEHIYALVTHRAAAAKAAAQGKDEKQASQIPLKALFLGGGSYTFPRYLQSQYASVECEVAEIDPAVTEANHRALGLPRDTTVKTTWGDARQYVVQNGGKKFDLIFGDAFNDFSVPWHLTTKDFNDALAAMLTDDGVYMINIIDVYFGDRRAVVKALYEIEVANAVQELIKANPRQERPDAVIRDILSELDEQSLGVDISKMASSIAEVADPPGNPQDGGSHHANWNPAQLRSRILERLRADATPLRGSVEEIAAACRKIRTRERSGNLLQLLEEARSTGRQQLLSAKVEDAVITEYEALLDDARRQSTAVDSERLGAEAILKTVDAAVAKADQKPFEPMLTVLSDHIRERLSQIEADEAADDLIAQAIARAESRFNSQFDSMADASVSAIARARNYSGFLASWVNTARKTFKHIYVFGTADRIGSGQRETFVVAAAQKPIDLANLGTREADPKFPRGKDVFKPEPYDAAHMKALHIRARGIELTDDYAPVENLLAPVAATRGED
jgi:MFS family permease